MGSSALQESGAPSSHQPASVSFKKHESSEGASQCRSSSMQNFGDNSSDVPNSMNRTDSSNVLHALPDGTYYQTRQPRQPYEPGTLDWESLPTEVRNDLKTPAEIAHYEFRKAKSTTAEPTLQVNELSPVLQEIFEDGSSGERIETRNDRPGNIGDSPKEPTSSPKKLSREQQLTANIKALRDLYREEKKLQKHATQPAESTLSLSGMPSVPITADSSGKSPPAQHKPLVVGRTKPKNVSMDSTNQAPPKVELNREIEKNLESNTGAAASADSASNPPKQKKEKAPKQPKPPKATPPTAPLSPALLDLRVGHILRAINHPNADSLYVSTIAMGDAEGTEHTSIDSETNKVVRTVCSGLNGLVPLAEMQDRKVIVVANLKPVNMRSIKSAAMVLAASPAMKEGDDPHAADRIVELVSPPEGAEAGDAVFFEGWEYGEGKGPEKQLNPKKKQWEAVQPGFFTSDDLSVGFDAGKSEVEGKSKGMLVVADKGKCTVKSLKGAVVR